MSNGDDIDALAGEYVLGTLDASERAMVDWQRRLAPLDAATRAVAPPADLFTAIERRIEASALPQAPRTSGASNVVDLVDWRRRATNWRRFAIAASTAAAGLMVWVGLRETVYRVPTQTYIGVFAENDVLPKFYLTIDLNARTMTVRPIDARRQDGMTYQLWIASDQIGPAPRSLGLVDDGLAPTTKVLTDYDPQLLQRATFGVSLERAGGSTTGRPSPGALHAKLLPVAN
jgi:anti-sigma-K factor RskA